MAALQGSSRGGGRRGRRTMAEINMVPFIDVMLVLLIIFMVTAPLITPSMIDLPSIGKAAKQPDKIIQVIIGLDDSIKIKIDNASEQAVNKDQLATSVQNALQASAPGAVASTALANSAVVISADKNVKYESVVRIMDTLQRAGLPRIGLSVQLAP
ncbi:MAG: Biopolymer transport protein ExbD [Pseudomonadota bacterium]